MVKSNLILNLSEYIKIQKRVNCKMKIFKTKKIPNF